MSSKRHVPRSERKQFRQRCLEVLDREYGGPYAARAKADLQDPSSIDIMGIAYREKILPAPRNAKKVARMYHREIDGPFVGHK